MYENCYIEITNELKVLGFEEAMASANKADWQASEGCKHDLCSKMVGCCGPLHIPQGANIIDSMWSMKKKENGEYCARLAVRGFKHMQGKSFVHHDISSLVIHDITAWIALVLMLKGSMIAHLVDVNGHFYWVNASLTKRYT